MAPKAKKNATTRPISTARRKQVRQAQSTYRARQRSLLSDLKEQVANFQDSFCAIGQAVNQFQSHLARQDPSSAATELFQKAQQLCSDISAQLQRCRQDNMVGDSQEETASEAPETPHQYTIALRSKPAASHTQQPSSDPLRLFLTSRNGLFPSLSSGHMVTSSEVQRQLTIDYPTTPFTRRLFYDCAVAGYYFLSDLTLSDEQVWPRFGMSLEGVPRLEVVDYFQRVLATTHCTPIQDPRFPFCSVGGAGTHFSRVPGSSAPPHLQNLDVFRATNGLRVIEDAEEWFDVMDVEGYMNSMGIKLTDDMALLAPLRNSLLDANFEDPAALGASESSGTSIIIHEKTFINAMKPFTVSLGCAAGFRKQDVERVVWNTARFIRN
ncbi:hypothetical protein VHEMI06154 [[Torrubiella] hemipterigena]|uniref:BZIP domain-containing protein n=1 Tax=[Torrubiella] hemipterigena TaxID=1531966 RepID=A0A0A1TID7_9HYPO|nr:hypothetical protein VHEMI06154 [[Torrubiella] hemipterigena]